MTEQRLGLRREQEEVASMPVVEGFLPQSIARQEQPTPGGIPIAR